jgi:putative spermidine/putrescine transport system substrate-binding protein
MKTILALTASVVTFTAALVPSKALADVNVMTWGGAWANAFNELGKKLEAETGVRVNVYTMQGGSSGGLAAIKARKDDPEIDVWNVNLIGYTKAVEEDLLEELPASEIPNVANVPENIVYSHGVAAWISMRGIAYRADMVPFGIKSWQDLWDPRLKGKLGVPDATFDTGAFPIVTALLAGSNERDIGPGLERIAELKDSIVTFYTSNDQAVQLLESGEVGALAYIPFPNFYAKLGGENNNLRFTVATDPTIIAPTLMTLIKNAPNRNEGIAFINYVLELPAQDLLAEALGSAPANKNAAIPEKMKQYIPDISNAYDIDFNVVSENLADWVKRYRREIQTR